MYEVNTAIVGWDGHVASWLFEKLQQSYDPAQTGVRINVPYVIARDKSKLRNPVSSPTHLMYSWELPDVLKDDEIDIVVELTSDLETSRKIILESLRHKKHVVTASKVLALYGKEILDEAKKNDRNIKFNASVGGEMQVLEQISAISYPITKIVGILNTTSHFVARRMKQYIELYQNLLAHTSKWGSGATPFSEKMKPYSEEMNAFQNALAEAQNIGLAEADPSFDVKGRDAAHKIAIASMIAWKMPSTVGDVSIEPFDVVKPIDIKRAKKIEDEEGTFRHVIEPIVLAQKQDDKLMLGSFPALIPTTHPLSQVDDRDNSVFVYHEGSKDPLPIYGKGAGPPTANAVISDIVQIAKNIDRGVVEIPSLSGKMEIIGQEDFVSSFYVRCYGRNIPGVFEKITGVFARHGINLEGILQPKAATKIEEEKAAITIYTSHESGRKINQALKELQENGFAEDILALRIFE